MAVIFGVEQVVDASVIFVSAFLAALLRRALHRLSSNALVQPFCASLLCRRFCGRRVPVPTHHLAAFRRALPMRDPRAGGPCAQRAGRSHQRPPPPRRSPPDSCRTDHCGDHHGSVVWAGALRRFPATRRSRPSRPIVATHVGGRSCGRGVRRLVLDATEAAAFTGRRRCICTSTTLGSTYGGLRSRSRFPYREPCDRADPHPGRTPATNAIRGDRDSSSSYR